MTYDHVADIYDVFVQTDYDHAFFLRATQAIEGEVLELTSGTGRLSVPLIEAGVKLVCVDSSAQMLAELRRKLDDEDYGAELVVEDIRLLDLGRKFPLIIFPFQSFAELQTRKDQQMTLRTACAHLAPDGRFICTLHNPTLRAQAVDGQLQFWGRRELPAQRTLLVWGVQQWDADEPGLVRAMEFFEEYDADGLLERKRLFDLSFRIVEQKEFEALLDEAGLAVEALYGNYDYTPFDAETSPFMIYVLRKA